MIGKSLSNIINEESNGDIPLYFKENTEYMFYDYYKPLKNKINLSEMKVGWFYFLIYPMDNSNWMKYSPVFLIEHKDIKGTKFLYAVNLNFLPLEIRLNIFQVTSYMYEDNTYSNTDFLGVYKKLLSFGFEYAIVEYNTQFIKDCLYISPMDLTTFLYSAYITNKYDPNKLYNIWSVKLKNREKRHQEYMKMTLEDFYKTKDEISEEYQVLKNHINRIKT